jgi:glycine oxidase
MIDYIIVGSGIAGISFAEIAIQHQKTVLVFENFSTNSSRIAGGLYNPVVLKRFSEVWKAKEQLEFCLPFYDALSSKLGLQFDYKVPIFRKFASIEEQNNWFHAADKPNLTPFLSTTIVHKQYQSISSDFGFGEVLMTGYIDVASLLEGYNSYLDQQKCFFIESFDYDALHFSNGFVTYKNIQAKQVIFAEGFALQSNPFFNYLPLDGTKGELLIIKAPNLNLDVVLKSSIFILPIGNDMFKVGATYNWEDKTDTPTEAGKLELIDNLKELIDCDFEVIEHFAGVRPTVKDRRPLVGKHDNFSQLNVLNGLGTRGVMLGPWLAKQLFEFIENGVSLDPNISIQRFRKKN